MENLEWHTYDRKGWPEGPWMSEPDKAQWLDEATGLPCLIVRAGDMKHLCGYVGVPEGHPLFGKSYNDAPDLTVHGGLTFADKCHPSENEGRGVCHIPGPGEPDHVWWFGFDCAHSGDLSPFDQKMADEKGGIWLRDWREEYRTVPYVRHQCVGLARQLKDAA